MQRYPASMLVTTLRDPFDDVVDLIRFALATDYVIELTETRHGITHAEAKRRAGSVTNHIGIALEFLEQATSGPIEVSFLPAYYAILNFLKVYILLGPHSASLAQQRTHGVTYNTAGKESRNILTERIKLDSKGAIPLAYWSITGVPLPMAEASRRVAMSDILPKVVDIGLELELANNTKLGLVPIQIGTEESNGIARGIANIQTKFANRISTRSLRVLKDFKSPRNRHNQFISPPLRSSDKEAEIRSCLRSFLFYHPVHLAGSLSSEGIVFTPLDASDLFWPEELPIALFFYYMSAVVRYRPEWMVRLRQSRYWPVVLSARRHALYKFTVLFASFLQQRTITMRRV